LSIPPLKNIRSLCVLLFLLVAARASAQFFAYPVEYFSSLITSKLLNGKDSSIHAGMQPYIPFFSEKYNNRADTHRIFKYIKEDPALDFAFFDHALNIKPRGTEFSMVIDPLVNFSTGREHNFYGRELDFTNGRGFISSGTMGKKFYFETLFSENQVQFPDFIEDGANKTSVIPGSGRWKRYKTQGFDYAYASGFISVQPLKNLNIQFGHGKHKIGNGYRSLLLSDNSFNYPYARITQQWFKGRLQYTNIYAVMTNFAAASATPSKFVEPLMQKKPAAFQYLSFNPAKFLNIGLFQGIMWQCNDKRNRPQVTWEYFDPLIFANAGTKGLSDTCNIIVGADLKIKLGNKISLYGQVAADDPYTDSTGIDQGLGYQAGLIFYDLFKIKHLFFQVEYNNVREGTYGNPRSAPHTDQSYSNLNQNLAYAPGHGTELLFIADYKFRRCFINARYHYQDVPKGGDYFYTTQIVTGNLGFVVNTAYNMTISLGYTYRNQKFPNFNANNRETNLISLSFKTALHNFYYDY
jgi:hypothetical protein